ncbi:MAG: hypothetical protein MUP70_11060 [Candidatus Aminicenantes bacterium]|nr:hypothetical protein [Candidatus Aminicenantes bacterium]
MTVRTKKNTFGEFLFDSAPASCVSFVGNTEIFFRFFQVMKFQSFGAFVIPTNLAFASFEIDRHLPNLLSPFFDSLDKIFSPIRVPSSVTQNQLLFYSQPLCQLSYRGAALKKQI